MWWMECQTECELCRYKCITPLPNLPRCFMIAASWQNTKADLIQKLCMTLLSLAIPPFRGDGQMTKKCPKFIYEYRQEISYPPVLPLFGGILGGYWPILPSIMGKKWGDKSFMLLARIIYSPPSKHDINGPFVVSVKATNGRNGSMASHFLS